MSRSLRAALGPSLLLVLTACAAGGGSDSDGSDWQHTTTTEGDLTIVETTAGSVWGGEAWLSEELSIGELEGADEYAFAGIVEIWATDGEVYVADAQLPAVRVFDHSGRFLREIGRPGQGPGEYEQPVGVATLPDGRVVIYDGVKMSVYQPDGTYQEQWGGASGGGFRFIGPDMTSVGDDGTIYVRTPILPEERRPGAMMIGGMRWGMKPYATDGTVGELVEAPHLEYEQPTVEIAIGSGRARMAVPFAPDAVWTMLPDGGFAAGVSDAYSFRIYRPDGTQLEIRKYHEPVPVDPDEVELRQSQTRIMINGQSPTVDWGDAEIPEFKPAFDALVATRDGRVLVLRSGPATVDPACLEPGLTSQDLRGMDCTDGITWADVFEPDGRFMGTFEVPTGVNLRGGVYIDGDVIWAPAQDDLGTVTVKRLRMVPPDGMPIT